MTSSFDPFSGKPNDGPSDDAPEPSSGQAFPAPPPDYISQGTPPPPPPPGQPQGPYPGWSGQAPGPAPVYVKPSGTSAGLALGLSIVGLLVCGGLLSPVGMIMGIKARNQIDAGMGNPADRGMATAAFIIGLLIMFFFIGVAVAGS